MANNPINKICYRNWTSINIKFHRYIQQLNPRNWYSRKLMKLQYYFYFWGRVDIDSKNTGNHFKGYKLPNVWHTSRWWWHWVWGTRWYWCWPSSAGGWLRTAPWSHTSSAPGSPTSASSAQCPEVMYKSTFLTLSNYT